MTIDKAGSRVPLSRACLAAHKSYNQLRRLLALGLVRGGWDAQLGYFIEQADVDRLRREKARREARDGGPLQAVRHGGNQ